MAFVPVPNTAKVEMIFTSNGQPCENVFHLEYPTSPGTPELNNLAADMKAWWTANLKPLVSANTSLTTILAADQTTQNAEVIEYTTGLPITGDILGSTSESHPNNVTLAVKWNTGLRGRSFRGRTYHIGSVESQTSGNNFLTVPHTAILAAYTALITYTWTDTGWVLVVASRFSNNLPRTTGVTTPIVSASANAKVDTQRRRMS